MVSIRKELCDLDIRDYINQNYDGANDWFVSECNNYYNMNKINKVIDIKEYLSGRHKILDREEVVWNNKVIKPKIVILQYAKVILNFSISYLLKNPVTLTGNEADVKVLKDVYKKGKYDRIDFDILSNMVKYGSCYEYIYYDNKGNITSRIIPPEDSVSIYSDDNKLIGFIEHYTLDNNISYYTVYYKDRVEKWNDAGGSLNLEGSWNNPSGLPIPFKSINELDSTDGQSELMDYINIIDNLEMLISKYFDGLDKYINPLFVVSGQKLNDGAVPDTVVGAGLNLDSDAEAKFISGKTDYKSFEVLFNTLKQALLDVSHTPGISMNSQEISNLSTTSMKLLYTLAEIKANLNERFMREGMEKRFEIIEDMLKVKGINVDSNNVDIVFQYARPMNEADIVENLKTLRDIGGISLESLLANAPYIYNVGEEMERLSNEKGNVKNDDDDS